MRSYLDDINSDMLDCLPAEILWHISTFLDENHDVKTYDLCIHTHNLDGHEFHASQTDIRCWFVRLFRRVAPITPIADQGNGLRYGFSRVRMGFDLCTARVRNSDGSLSFFTNYGEAVTLYNWSFKRECIPRVELYDAVVEARWTDLPAGRIVSLYKMPRLPKIREQCSPGSVCFDDGVRVDLCNRFMVVCDPRERRRELLSHRPDLLVSFGDMERSLAIHEGIDRDCEGTVAVMNGNVCVYGLTLDSHVHSTLDEIRHLSIRRMLRVTRDVSLVLTGELTRVAESSLWSVLGPSLPLPGGGSCPS